MEFYILDGNSKSGPFTVEQLRQIGILPTTLVWATGYTDWRQADSVPELQNILYLNPPAAPTRIPMPKTWLVESILVTCLCCLPLGIVGIIHSSKVESSYNMKLYDQALYHSNEAKKWSLIGALSSAAGIFIYIVIIGIIALIGAD